MSLNSPRLYTKQINHIASAIERASTTAQRCFLAYAPLGASGAEFLSYLQSTLVDWEFTRITCTEFDTERRGAFTGLLPASGSAHVVLVENINFASPAMLREILHYLRDNSASRCCLVATFSEYDARLQRLGFDTISLPPLRVHQVAIYVEDIVGRRLPSTMVENIQEMTGGWPVYIREVLESAPVDHWFSEAPKLPIPASWPQIPRHELTDALIALAQFDDGAPETFTSRLDETELNEAFNNGLAVRTFAGKDEVIGLSDPRLKLSALAGASPARKAKARQLIHRFWQERGDNSHAALYLPQNPDSLKHIQEAADNAEKEHRFSLAGQLFHRAYLLSADDSQASDFAQCEMQNLIQGSELALADLRWRDLPSNEVEPEHLAYLALYEGRKTAARKHAAQTSNPASIVRSLVALADWKPQQFLQEAQSMQTSAGSSEAVDAQNMEILATAIHHGIDPDEEALLKPQDPHARQRQQLALGWIALAHDRPIDAREYLRSAQLPQQGTYSEIVRTWQDGLLARTLLVLGEWDKAQRVVERGLARSEACSTPLLDPLLIWTGAQVSGMRGDQQLANSYIDRLQLDEESFVLSRIPGAMTKVAHSSRGTKTSSALRAIAELEKAVSGVDSQQSGFWPWEDIYAQTLVRAGQIDRADDVLTQAEEIHAKSGLPSIVARNMVPRAAILITRGETNQGIKVLDDALDAISNQHMPLYHARILLEYGKTLRRIGRRSRADELLAQASDVYSHLNASAMVQLCEQERRISGVGTHSQGLPGLGLTPQEEQIALRVSDGLTNAEVATELALSSKTVEHHLTRVYRKLKVKSRRELRDFFHNTKFGR